MVSIKMPNTKSMIRFGAYALLVFGSFANLAPGVAQAQSVGAAGVEKAALQKKPTLLSFTIPVEVRKSPDRALLTAGVLTEAVSAQEAIQQNAKQMARVFEALRKATVAPRDIQTQGVVLQPLYLYQENQPPRIRGYQASNTISLRIRKIETLGSVLDQLVAEGVSQISGPSFDVEAPDAALDQARAEALKTAQARATLMATAVGMRIKRLVSIQEAGSIPEPGPVPFAAKAMIAQAAQETTPIAGGDVRLSSSLSVVFELE